MPLTRCLVTAAVCLSALPALAQSTEPTAVIDTTAGRITCTLLTHDRPNTTRLFLGLVNGEPFEADLGAVLPTGTTLYDGAAINPSSSGIAIRTRVAGPTLPAEATPPMLFDSPGLLAMSISRGTVNPSRLLITDHANKETDGRAVIFGHCDQASAKLAGSLRHTLQVTDNHPETQPVIDHITIVPPGQPLPAIARPATTIYPTTTTPLAPPSGPEPTGPTAILETTAGRISCRLFTKESPIATTTFLALVDGSKDWTDPRTHALQHNHRFYDGMPFDRVFPDYYLQFGDITGDISGKTDIGFRFPNETTPGLTFDRPGRLAFGNGGKDTNNSELFFALNPMHSLDSGYTIIGQCDTPILDRIAQLPRDAANLPLTPVIIRRITIQP